MIAASAGASSCSITATLCIVVRLMRTSRTHAMPTASSRILFVGGTSTVIYHQLTPSAWKAASCMAPVGSREGLTDAADQFGLELRGHGR
jgi:hypothetical protein